VSFKPLALKASGTPVCGRNQKRSPELATPKNERAYIASYLDLLLLLDHPGTSTSTIRPKSP
jgi:hypothetical protein